MTPLLLFLYCSPNELRSLNTQNSEVIVLLECMLCHFQKKITVQDLKHLNRKISDRRCFIP